MKKKVSINYWKTKEDSGVCDTNYKLNLLIEKSEFEKIILGLLPTNMEDKWFICEENGKILFFRSWTGRCLASLEYEDKREGVLLTGIKVNSSLTNKMSMEEIINDIFDAIRIIFDIEITKNKI